MSPPSFGPSPASGPQEAPAPPPDRTLPSAGPGSRSPAPAHPQLPPRRRPYLGAAGRAPAPSGGGNGGSESPGPSPRGGGEPRARPARSPRPSLRGGVRNWGLGNRGSCGRLGEAWVPPGVCGGGSLGGGCCPPGPGLPRRGQVMGRRRGAGGAQPEPGTAPAGPGQNGGEGLEGGRTAPANSSCSLLLPLLFFCEWAAAPLLRGEVPVSLTFERERRSLLTYSIGSLSPGLDGSLLARKKI